jgi:aqualysin 1
MRRAVLAMSLLSVLAGGAHAGDVRVAETDGIDGRYIVVFKDSALNAEGLSSLQATAQHASTFNISARRVFRHALRGYSVAMSAEQAEAVASDPRVAWVEQDARVRASIVQFGATWGLDRIDQRNLPLSNSYTYNYNGSSVHAYIIDTGIRGTHIEFTGRMAPGFTAVIDGNGTGDCHGHGTHVAGTVGGTTYGVAKQVALHPVRVLDCAGNGSYEGVIQGVEWVTANHTRPAVANMSLGGPPSDALDAALNTSIAAGVTYVVAAGNSTDNACFYSPARVPNALTVGATTNTDVGAWFSNFGTCVDLFAPGQSITAAWNTADNHANTISGTSMASPHVAGVAALYLQQNGAQPAAAVTGALLGAASVGKLTGIGAGSPNRLLYSLFPDTVPSYEAEHAALSGTAAIATCTFCSNGQRVGGIGGTASNHVTFNVLVGAPGTYNMRVDFVWMGVRTFSVSVNGGAPTTLNVSGASWTQVSSVWTMVALGGGSNSIRFSNSSTTTAYLDRITITGGSAATPTATSTSTPTATPTSTPTATPTSTPTSTPTATPTSMSTPTSAPTSTPTSRVTPRATPRVTPTPEPGSYEAEAGVLGGTSSISNCSACSGGKRVGFGGAPPSDLTLTVTAAATAPHSLRLDFVWLGTRSVFISVNGGPGAPVSLTGTSWILPASATTSVSLSAGSNTIRFYNDAQPAPYLDKIVVAP